MSRNFVRGLVVLLVFALGATVAVVVHQSSRISDLEAAAADAKFDAYRANLGGLERDYVALCVANNGPEKSQECRVAAEYVAGIDASDQESTDGDERYAEAKRLIE